MNSLRLRTPDASRTWLPLTDKYTGMDAECMYKQAHWCECVDTALLERMVCVDIKNIFTFMRCVAKTAYTTTHLWRLEVFRMCLHLRTLCAVALLFYFQSDCCLHYKPMALAVRSPYVFACLQPYTAMRLLFFHLTFGLHIRTVAVVGRTPFQRNEKNCWWVNR